MARTTAAAGVATLVLFGAVHACSGAPSEAGADAGAEPVVADARTERAPPTEDDGPYASPFEGWDVFHEYDPGCGLYVPKSAEYLPPPIRWEPCRANAATAGKVCREMVLDWPKKKLVNELISPATRGIRRPDGRIALSTARFQADATYRMIAEIDGPVLVALREQDATKCVLSGEISDGDHYAFRVLDREAKGEVSEYGGGAIGGRYGELRPKVLRHYHDSATRSFMAGAPGLLELSGGAMLLHRWSDGERIKTIWSSAQEPGGLTQSYQMFHRSTLFWASSGVGINKEKIYTEVGGVQDFVSFGMEVSRGAADLGTDGVDLVWLEGSGRSQPREHYRRVAVLTAPFTTDPARLQATKRTLREDLSSSPFGLARFVVGCGYAARAMDVPQPDGTWTFGSLVVRLSDGYSWYLPTSMAADWAWAWPLGLTCEELIIRIAERAAAGERFRTNVARVRLDSLGPGTPP